MKRSLLVCAVLFLLCANFIYAQEKKTVAGIVQDEKGGPLVGVSVMEKSGSAGTLTDANGAFKLNVSTDATLTLSYVGYIRQEVPLNGRVSLVVRMLPDSKGLNEIVVTAMGIKRERRKLGYAVSNISGDELVKASPTNFASAMYGKAAGVAINTAPGGGTSSVTIKIRGLNSILNDNQPLIVVDGVPIRNDIVNNNDYWGDDRIRGNSLLDINPDNIQDISILKGAAASALYGSSGSNGVVMITTKSGKKRPGIGVDVNYSYGVEQATQLPKVQTLYGPGYYRQINMENYGSADGWINIGDVNGDGKEDGHPALRAYGQFGTKYDGREMYDFDGVFRKYVGHDDVWKKFYQTGHTSQANVALSNATDRGSYRFSYNRNDYEGIQRGGKQEKNTFNFNSNYKITPRLSSDVVVTFINEFVHNRPARIGLFTNEYAGFFSAADDMDTYLERYKTTKGYKYVSVADPNNAAKDPEEAFKYNIRPYNLLDFFWKQLRNSYDEKSNRVISSFTLSYDISKNLKFRGRMGNDFTGYNSEQKNYAEYPLAFGESGQYISTGNQYNLIYGDVLLSYNKDFSPKFGLNASIGYQARREQRRFNSMATQGGLIQENFFTMQASKNPVSGQNETRRTDYLQDGILGVLGLSYRNFLFLEGTGRYERISTLAPGNNAYFYPSVSLSFELTKALKLPNMIDYSKLRMSYGVVATPPEMYTANIVYSGISFNGIPMLYPGNNYGNNDLKPEFKHEFEVGWETKMYENRLGLDISYYNNIVKGQISNLTVPSSTGAKSIWRNVGDLNNYGIEISLYGTPIAGKNFVWDIRGNIGYNRNKLKSLAPGTNQLQIMSLNNASLLITADVNRPAGDIWVWDYKRNDEGVPIINSDGLYDSDFNKRIKVGNIQPDLVGGLSNNFAYKSWNLGVLVDFRWGGQLVSPSNFFGMGAGLYENTLQYRDEAHGGLTYYEDAGGNRTLLPAGASAPAGTTVYHDGVVLDGVDATGKKNDKIIEAAYYYFNTFTWGNSPNDNHTNSYKEAVFDNNYIKLREVSLNYSFPVKFTNKARLQTLSLGIFGRNLFYFYKTLPNLDPEVGAGTNFLYQGLEQGTSAASRTMGVNLKLSF